MIKLAGRLPIMATKSHSFTLSSWEVQIFGKLSKQTKISVFTHTETEFGLKTGCVLVFGYRGKKSEIYISSSFGIVLFKILL